MRRARGNKGKARDSFPVFSNRMKHFRDWSRHVTATPGFDRRVESGVDIPPVARAVFGHTPVSSGLGSTPWLQSWPLLTDSVSFHPLLSLRRLASILSCSRKCRARFRLAVSPPRVDFPTRRYMPQVPQDYAVSTHYAYRAKEHQA